jgi:hypothetical protein
MARWLIDNKSDEYDLRFVFANTGLEHENTLKFVDRCDREWGLNLTWLEAVTHHGADKGCTHKIVNYKDATRGMSVFVDMVEKYGIPNAAYLHCNRELKLNPIKSWKRGLNLIKCKYALGIRVDEIDRMSADAKKRNIIYPLIAWRPTYKAEIIDWWSRQPFDLEIKEHYGNCVTCWKKSARKLLTVAKYSPEHFDAFDYMEQNLSECGAGDEPRQFNAGKKFNQEKISVRELVYKAHSEPFNEFIDYKPEYQLDLIGYDQSEGCEESCEPFA